MPDKILVVDDEPDTVNLAKMILEGEGFRVVVASNGSEALQKADSEGPDLILLDVVMPGISGFEACKTLKSKPRTRLIPIVMFSALGRDVDKKLGREAGADGYLTKPFTLDGLVAEVKKHLEEARLEKFSKALGLDHARLMGRKILLEFDPAASYERAVRGFVAEAQAHGEVVVVLASRASVIHQTFEGEKDVELVLLTPQTILSPILEAHAGKLLAVVYDNLTDLILSSGFQPAYNFTKNTLERLAGPKLTTLFLLNPNAHAPNEAYSIRSLFSEQVTYGENGLTRVKLT